MMPSKAKGTFVYRASGKRKKSSSTGIANAGPSMTTNNAGSSIPPPDSTSRLSMLAPPLRPLASSMPPPPLPPHLSPHPSASPSPPQTSVLSVARFPAASSDVSERPSTPSTFLSPSDRADDTSVVTSVSRGKRKASVVGSEAADGAAQSRKRSRGSSAATGQKETVAAINKVTDTIEGITKALGSSTAITFSTAPDSCEMAIDILNEYENDFPADDYLDLCSHLTHNKPDAVVFVRVSTKHRKAWLDRLLKGVSQGRNN